MSLSRYTPVPSTIPFFISEKYISMIVGPIGSTKTTAGIYKIAYEAKKVAACKDGIRRSRCAWVRQTSQMLRDSSIPDFLKAFPDGIAGVFMRSEMKFLLKFDDVECEVWFRNLDTPDDIRRLLSTQYTFAVIEEFRECNREIFEAVQGRLGRYPDGLMVPHQPEWGVDSKNNPIQGCVDDFGKSVDKVWMMSNPPDMDTYWEETIANPTENMHVTIQPGGLSEEADWIHLLKSNFYENLVLGKGEDWIDVYINAKFGKSLSGKPVFRCFNRDMHVAKEEIKFYTHGMLVIGVDAGLNPTAVITQMTYDGRVLVLEAITGAEGGMGALRFIRERLKPLLAEKYPGLATAIIIDPAAFQRAQTDERCVADMFKAEGFQVKAARTNSIAARIAAVEKYLTRIVEGKPAFLVNPEVSLVIQALAGKYRYKVNQKGIVDDKPDKLHPWSDVCFVAGTPVLTQNGYVRIETLRPGDMVVVPGGVDEVTHTGSRFSEKLVRVILSNGVELVCTPDHPFAVNTSCFLPADALYSGLELIIPEDVWGSQKVCVTQQSEKYLSSAAYAAQNFLRYSGKLIREKVKHVLCRAEIWAGGVKMVCLSTGCGLGRRAKTSTSGTRHQTKRVSLFTSTNGKKQTVRCQKGMKCTTRTTIRATMIWGTLKSWILRSIAACTSNVESTLGRWTHKQTSLKPGKQQKNGMPPPKDENGIESTLRRSSIHVVRVDSVLVGQNVFNLTTRNTHVFYAGGVLVHNCDALQYACLHHDGGALFGAVNDGGRRETEVVSLAGWT